MTETNDDEFNVLDDSATPAPELSKAERVAKKTAPAKVEEAYTSELQAAGDTTSQAIVHMMRLRPFLGLFLAYADVRFSRRQSKYSRVDAMIECSPVFYRVCLISDWVFITVLCLLVLAFLVGNLWELFVN
ncbi:MAG: hypothetical protein QP772_00080 [Actinomycetaceae bacterium UMB1218B]|nr:hypothetical protein [Actinomycetaceae bacterium UMB1218B]